MRPSISEVIWGERSLVLMFVCVPTASAYVDSTTRVLPTEEKCLLSKCLQSPLGTGTPVVSDESGRDISVFHRN